MYIVCSLVFSADISKLDMQIRQKQDLHVRVSILYCLRYMYSIGSLMWWRNFNNKLSYLHRRQVAT